jgi:glutathione-regulated potassium-efflux system ancillary protein KefG
MKILVNVFHPHLADQSRVNSRWVQELEKSNEITINLEYANYSDWEIDIEREQKLLLEHERIIFQHPFFWFSTPPLMKKRLDDVLTYAWAHGPGGTALKGKEWISAISAGGPADAYQAGGYNNYSMSELLKPLQQTANLIGMKFLPAYVFHGAVQASENEIEASAAAYLAHITNPELDPEICLTNLLAEMEAAGANLEA